jgi:hypothetical protein
MRRCAASCLIVLAVLGGATAGCTDDEEPTTAPTTSVAREDPDLERLALSAADLPPGFAPSPDVDDTITSFCANEDAAAGLRASGRMVRGFTREGGGASVIQLAFRFEDGGAATFVAQAGEILERCSGVPDGTGLAFEYAPLAPELEALVGDSTDAHAGRYGTSVGSGNLTVDLVAFVHGDVAQLVAVLGLQQPRADLDALAVTTFEAALAEGAQAVAG